MTRKPRSLDELPDDITLPALRRAWADQDGIKLLRSERCRRRGRRETWELWRFTPRRPPKMGPRCSYIVISWAPGWTTWLCMARAEAERVMRHRGGIPVALIPPLFG